MLADYQPVLPLMKVTANFSERLSTLTYSYQNNCSLYPRRTSYFSVKHTEKYCLSLPLTQRLSEEAVTVNMTKFNTVPTNMSGDVGNIVTKNVTWGTSAVFGEINVTREWVS